MVSKSTFDHLLDLTGRVALITGGAGHLGAAMGEALAEVGASIAVLDLNDERCQAAAGGLQEQFGVATLPLAIDLGNEHLLKAVPETVGDKFGRLDIVINCAAMVGTSELQGWAVPFAEQSVDAWRQALEINLTAPFVLLQACAPLLKNSGHGSVINIGSIYGMVGPDMGLYCDTSMGNPAAYAASKGGLLQLTRWLATVLAPAVRVNAITLGGIERGQSQTFKARYNARTPLGRLGTEIDVKGAVTYLASDLSSYMTGQNIILDGGWTAW